jgi:hypothetical protein
MGNTQRAPAVAADGFNFYRVTSSGKAAVGGRAPLRSRYLVDLLEVFQTCGNGIFEHELRQFMPPASLVASIGTLLELGLIECDEPPAVQTKRFPGRRVPLLAAAGRLIA